MVDGYRLVNMGAKYFLLVANVARPSVGLHAV